jgi:septum formation topological specificity factor MinE
MLKLTGKDLQERLELRFPDYARRERERIEILRRLRAGEITDQISPYDKSRVETAVVQMESQGGLATLVAKITQTARELVQAVRSARETISPRTVHAD